MMFLPSLRSFRRFGIRAGAAVLLVAAVACGRSDSTIENDARTRLQGDPLTQNSTLTVAVDGGVVRLSGEAMNRRAQERAVELARSVEGVTEVVNEIQVRQNPLETAVRSALRGDPLVADVPIEVEVAEHDDNLIILRSDQTNQEQRARAVEVARQVAGVGGVEDMMK